MLKHYGFYLNDDPDGEDYALIQFLEKYVKTRRVGEITRRALFQVANLSPMPNMPPVRMIPAAAPAPVQSAMLAGPAPSTNGNDVVLKARNAFMKR